MHFYLPYLCVSAWKSSSGGAGVGSWFTSIQFLAATVTIITCRMCHTCWTCWHLTPHLCVHSLPVDKCLAPSHTNLTGPSSFFSRCLLLTFLTSLSRCIYGVLIGCFCVWDLSYYMCWKLKWIEMNNPVHPALCFSELSSFAVPLWEGATNREY